MGGPGEVEKKAAGELGVRYTFHPDPALRRKVSFHADSNYSIHRVGVFYDFFIDDKDWPAWLRKSGPELELFYSHTLGHFRNEDSSRDQVGLLVGYRQTFLNHLRVVVNLGLDYADNRLDFGEGFIPYRQESLNLWMQAAIGAEYCIGPVCINLGAGYVREDSLAGKPEYYNHGWFVQAGASVVIETEPEKTAEPAPPLPRSVAQCPRAPRQRTLIVSNFINVPAGVEVGSSGAIPTEISQQLDGFLVGLRRDPSVKVFLRVGGPPPEAALQWVRAVRHYLVTNLHAADRVISDAEDNQGGICPEGESLTSGIPEVDSGRTGETVIILELFREGNS